jgi:NMD protein affecting ribosome stability and mRNA decay
MRCIKCGRNTPKTTDGICHRCKYQIKKGLRTYNDFKNRNKLVNPRQREQKRRYNVNVETHTKI